MNIKIGDNVFNSPVGPGKFTGITQAGYPQVNHIAVARMVTLGDDGNFQVYDPMQTYKSGNYRMATSTSLGVRCGDVVVSSYEEAQAFIKAVGCEPKEVLKPHYFTLSKKLKIQKTEDILEG